MFNFLVGQILDRANNQVETANVKLCAELGMKHPTIWRFHSGQQRNRYVFVEKLIEDDPSPSELKKSMKADERLLKIVSSFSHRSPTECLRGSAYNFQ